MERVSSTSIFSEKLHNYGAQCCWYFIGIISNAKIRIYSKADNDDSLQFRFLQQVANSIKINSLHSKAAQQIYLQPAWMMMMLWVTKWFYKLLCKAELLTIPLSVENEYCVGRLLFIFQLVRETIMTKVVAYKFFAKFRSRRRSSLSLYNYLWNSTVVLRHFASLFNLCGWWKMYAMIASHKFLNKFNDKYKWLCWIIFQLLPFCCHH